MRTGDALVLRDGYSRGLLRMRAMGVFPKDVDGRDEPGHDGKASPGCPHPDSPCKGGQKPVFHPPPDPGFPLRFVRDDTRSCTQFLPQDVVRS
jgi:hypothetical protein